MLTWDLYLYEKEGKFSPSTGNCFLSPCSVQKDYIPRIGEHISFYQKADEEEKRDKVYYAKIFKITHSYKGEFVDIEAIIDEITEP